MKKLFMIALVLLASVVTGQNTPQPETPPALEKRPAEAVVVMDDIGMMKLVRERKGGIQDVFASAAPQPPTPAPVVTAPPKPTAPPLPFSYFGRLKTPDRLVIYLLRNEEVLLAEAGQTLDTNYRVVSVSETAVQFVYLPLDTRQTLNFTAAQ